MHAGNLVEAAAWWTNLHPAIANMVGTRVLSQLVEHATINGKIHQQELGHARSFGGRGKD